MFILCLLLVYIFNFYFLLSFSFQFILEGVIFFFFSRSPLASLLALIALFTRAVLFFFLLFSYLFLRIFLTVFLFSRSRFRNDCVALLVCLVPSSSNPSLGLCLLAHCMIFYLCSLLLPLLIFLKVLLLLFHCSPICFCVLCSASVPASLNVLIFMTL